MSEATFLTKDNLFSSDSSDFEFLVLQAIDEAISILVAQLIDQMFSAQGCPPGIAGNSADFALIDDPLDMPMPRDILCLAACDEPFDRRLYSEIMVERESPKHPFKNGGNIRSMRKR